MSTQTKTETTSIKGADEFAARARELGLKVEVKQTRTEAVYYRDGGLMLPAVTAISVIVSLPVPEELDNTALGLIERSTQLHSCWSKSDRPRARGRWTLANYSTLGGHEDMHVLHKAYRRLESMAEDLKRLRKLVQG